MAKQRWKAVKMKQKFDRQRFQNFSGSYSDQDLFISKGGSEKEIYVPEEGADTGLFASVLQVWSKFYPLYMTYTLSHYMLSLSHDNYLGV